MAPALHAVLIRDLVDDGQLTCALAWLELAKEPLDIQALAIAVAISTNPGCRTTQQLRECRPKFDEGSADNAGSTDFEVVGRELHFKKRPVKDILAHNPLSTNLELSQPEWTELSLAKACIRFLSLEDFREYPIRREFKGRDMELWKLHPFLRYAAPYWHKHAQSVEDVALLEPELDKIIDPAQNYLYFWIDQESGSCGNGSREFFRSRCEVAIKFDLPWLALYLLDSTSTEVEDMFPARDLKFIARYAPGVLQLLLRKNEQYYLPVITKKLLTKSGIDDQSFIALVTLANEHQMLQIPPVLLWAMAYDREGDPICDSMISSINSIPITRYTLLTTTKSLHLLKTFFQEVPGVQVDSAMLRAAFGDWNTLQFLLARGGEIHVTEDMLLMAVKQYCDVGRLQLLLEACSHRSVPSKVIKAAIKLNRLEMVKYIFEYDKDLKISKEILETAVAHGGNELDIQRYILDRCDVSLITEDILLAAVRRYNSAFKTVKLVWHYKNDLKITDEILVASMSEYSELTDWLLSIQERHEVPHEVVDVALERANSRYFPQSGFLKTLQQRVPNDPYLKKALAKIDFSPPEPKSSGGGRTRQTAHYSGAVPNAAMLGDLDNLIAILNKGEDIDGRTGSSCSCDRNNGVGTALQRAVKLRDIEMAKLLLDRGANPDIQEGSFGNPLQEASMAGDLELVQLLLEHKAMINHRGGQYSNPLTAAARANDVKIVQFLIENGADTNIADDNGWTPYLWAVASESHHVVRFLQDRYPSIGAIGELIALWPSRLKDHVSIKMGDDRLITLTGILLSARALVLC